MPGQPSDQVREAIDSNYEAWLPAPVRAGGGTQRAREPRREPVGARAKRRAQYARVQRRYDRDHARCAQEIITGKWREPPASLPMSAQEPFWRDLFETPSVPDSRAPDPVGRVCWELLHPITSEDVARALRKMKDGVPGPDGRKLSDVRAIPAEELAGHFNLWLLAGYPPAQLRRGETVLLPKCEGAGDPSKYRPITMSDIVVRCFHRILAQRMEVTLPFNTRQKAFRAGDGVADSVWFIQAVIKHHQDNLRPLNVAFVDVKKAFDSVSHQSMLVAAARLGVPAPFLGYIRELYSDAVTALRIGPQRSAPISLGRGVRQGDPLSVHLFNAVIDMCLAGLDAGLGCEVGELRVNHGAFADDIALFATTPRGLQALASQLEYQLALCGLSISSGPRGKSASLCLDIDGKAKKWVVNPLPYLRIAEETVPAVSVSQVYRYLGVDISPRRTSANVEGVLREGLASISSAPLKPHQRLYIATYHLLPKCQHQLSLAPASAKYLKWLDRMVRSAVRSWLKLPKDTPTPFFHAPVVEGGLGIPLHEHFVPLMKAKRLSRLDDSPDPVIAAMLTSVSATAGLARQIRRTSLNGLEVTSSRDLKGTLAEMLHRTVDGRGLAHSSQVLECHRWVNSVGGGGAPNAASSYIAAIKVRGNLIGTALRRSRDRPQVSSRCDCCGRPESLGHILQVCPRTHASRIARHDKIVDLVEKALTQKGYSICRKPAIPTPAGIRRPDLVVERDSAVTVLDVTIVADNADLT